MTITIRVATWLSATLVAVLAACGSSDSSGGGDAYGSSNAGGSYDSGPTVPSITKTTAPSTPAEYAAVATASLSAIGLPADLTLAQLKVVSGVAQGLLIKDGEIRFLTPSDPGSDATVELLATFASSEVTVPVALKSVRQTQAVAVAEPDELGNVPDQAKKSTLVVKGLGSGNAVVAADWSFAVPGAPAIDPKASSGIVFIPQSGAKVDLAKDWVLDPVTNTLNISLAKVQALLANIPSGEVEFDIALTSLDGSFAVAWTFQAYKPQATISGRVTTVDGTTNVSAAGKQVALRGIDNLTRLVTTVDGGGNFSFGSVVAGTFEVTVLDPEFPNFWTATVPIFPSSTTVSVSLPYVQSSGAASPATPGAVAPKSLGSARRLESNVVQDGSAPRARDVSAVSRKAATPAGCESVGAAGEATYTATAAARDSSISCLANYTIPKGTAQVGVLFTITSAEFPTYTQSKSQYNDTWAFAVAGLPNVASGSGSVNDTHYSQGTITRKFCVDVSTLAKDGDKAFTANLTATNIGDSALATAVTMNVKLQCDASLSVTKAEFGAVNKKGFSLIQPGGGGLANNYISIPILADVPDWGIPLTVEYEPKTVTITKVRIGVVVNAKAVMADVDLSGQISSRSDGKLKFDNLVIPRIPVTKFSGKTNVVLELTGTSGASTLVSTAIDGSVKFSGVATFVPLFLADDFVGGARRYGQSGTPDAGLDSWSTFNTIDWLTQRSFRYNDISALHVARTPAGRSVLDHAGHSDGTQIDMRYADGSGGFSEDLGGAGNGGAILKMLNDAAAEVAKGGIDPKPNLVKANAWILANRQMAETESAGARKMHMGPSWMKLALFDGKFPDGKTLIPNVDNAGAIIAGPGSWTTKPANLSFVDPHLHHWHISLSGI